MTTLYSTTRRISHGKGNYIQNTVINNSLYSAPSAAVNNPIQKNMDWLQPVKVDMLRMEDQLEMWRASEFSCPVQINAQNWNAVTNIVNLLYDPLVAPLVTPDILVSSSATCAATFSALSTALLEKLHVLENILDTTTEVARRDPGAFTRTVLLTDDDYRRKIKERTKQLAESAEPKSSGTDGKFKDKQVLIQAKIHRMESAAQPHTPIFFDTYDTASSVTGPHLSASTMHSCLVEHLFKVAYKRFGPCRDEHHRLQLLDDHKQKESNPLYTDHVSRYIVENSPALSPCVYRTASVFFCDIQDYEAYSMLDVKYKSSPVLPESNKMKDLPFRPFVVPYSYKTSEGPSIQTFMDAKFVSRSGTAVAFDYGEFLCYSAFGFGWDYHLRDVVGILERKNHAFPNGWIYVNPMDNNYVGAERNGIPDMVLRSFSDFIRGTCNSDPVDLTLTTSTELDDMVNSILCIQGKIKESLAENTGIVDILHKEFVNMLQLNTRECVSTSDPEVMCLVAHLFFSTILDRTHVHRNVDIERTLYKTDITTTKPAKGSSCRTVYFPCMSDIPDSVLQGITGRMPMSNTLCLEGDNRLSVVWDSSSYGGRVFSVIRMNAPNHSCAAAPSLQIVDYVCNIRETLRRLYITERERQENQTLYFNRDKAYRVLAAHGFVNAGHGYMAEARDIESYMCLNAKRGGPPERETAALAPRKSFMAAFWEAVVASVLSKTGSAPELGGIGTEVYRSLDTEYICTAQQNPQVRELLYMSNNTNMGIEYSCKTGTVVFSLSRKGVLEQCQMLRSNSLSLSVFLETNLNITTPAQLNTDVEFAAEMTNTYPDSLTVAENRAVRDFSDCIPESQRRVLNEIGGGSTSDMDVMANEINQTELAKASDTVLSREAGNGVTCLFGRFGEIATIAGSLSLPGFLGYAAVNLVKASTGAHFNVLDLNCPHGVRSHILTGQTCRDMRLLCAAENPISPSNNCTPTTKVEQEKMPHPAFVPLCGYQDTPDSRNGTRVLFASPMQLSPLATGAICKNMGSSLSWGKGLSVLEATSSVLMCVPGRNVANSLVDVAEEAVDGCKGNLCTRVVCHPGFVFGLPITVGLVATGLKGSNWLAGVIATAVVFVLIVITRFFVGSGCFTQNWFCAGMNSNRSAVENMVLGGEDVDQAHLCNAVPSVRHVHSPVFGSAISNYIQTAKSIGCYPKPSFKGYYANIFR